MSVIVFGSSTADRRLVVASLEQCFLAIDRGDGQKLIYVDQPHHALADLLRNREPVSALPGPAEIWLPFFEKDHSASSLDLGGKGCNQAVAAARAGAETHFYTALGDTADHASWQFKEQLEKTALSSVTVQHIPYKSAAQALILQAPDQSQIEIIYTGANKFAEQAHVSDNILTSGNKLLLQTSVPIEQSMLLAKRARAAGCTVFLNATKPNVVKAEHFSLVDEWLFNREEALHLAAAFGVDRGEDAKQLALNLSNKLRANCLITLGEQGAVFASPSQSHEEVIHVPAYPIAQLVDPTGAGDAFIGTYVARMHEGDDRQAAMHQAAHIAALTCLSRKTQLSGEALRPSHKAVGQRKKVAGL